MAPWPKFKDEPFRQDEQIYLAAALDAYEAKLRAEGTWTGSGAEVVAAGLYCKVADHINKERLVI